MSWTGQERRFACALPLLVEMTANGSTGTASPQLDHAAQLVPIDGLKPFKGNPRRGDVELIRESLRANGQFRPVVVRAKTREVLAGNHTMLAAQAEGWTELWATFVDVDAKTAKRIVLADNRTGDRATYEDEDLAALLKSLDGELGGTGFEDADVAKLLKRLEPLSPDAVALDQTFEVIVQVPDEAAQVALLERLTGEGLTCRALL